MDVTAESLHERYSAMKTEALADFYHGTELTELAVSVLKDVVTSRGLEWAEFTARADDTESVATSKSEENWSLWKSRPEPPQAGKEGPSIEGANQSAERNLNGIAGWLILYSTKFVLGTVLIVGDLLLTTMDLETALISVTVLIIFLVGLYLLVLVRKPITRVYHIGLNSLLAAVSLVVAFSAALTSVDLTWILWLIFCTEPVIWTMYWIRSKRVQATYRTDNRQTN